MTEVISISETIVKYGVRGLMVILLIWMNNRLNKVEDKLYECFDDKEDILKNRALTNNNNNKTFYIKPIMVAILPGKEHNTIKKEDEEIDC